MSESLMKFVVRGGLRGFVLSCLDFKIAMSERRPEYLLRLVVFWGQKDVVYLCDHSKTLLNCRLAEESCGPELSTAMAIVGIEQDLPAWQLGAGAKLAR